jgi:hypothetical protein
MNSVNSVSERVVTGHHRERKKEKKKAAHISNLKITSSLVSNFATVNHGANMFQLLY